ncbi:hypothetical protein LCGC14_0390440 [marine sediment metagenome]|uniref:Uncharacterized protein n=1 Tax=marine sediment metagenome TaxID=412755 RepID=A0A0F9T5H2_9ZZZZ
MTEQERRLRLNEMGKEIAAMHPKKIGAVMFDMVNGKLTGVREGNGWRTGNVLSKTGFAGKH